MAYAIANFIYGINLTEPANADYGSKERNRIYEMLDHEKVGMVSHFYNGNGDMPVFIGEELGSVNEFENKPFDKVKIKPTKKQKEKTLKKIEFLRKKYPEFEKYFKEEPKVWILWGTS